MNAGTNSRWLSSFGKLLPRGYHYTPWTVNWLQDYRTFWTPKEKWIDFLLTIILFEPHFVFLLMWKKGVTGQRSAHVLHILAERTVKTFVAPFRWPSRMAPLLPQLQKCWLLMTHNWVGVWKLSSTEEKHLAQSYTLFWGQLNPRLVDGRIKSPTLLALWS